MSYTKEQRAANAAKAAAEAAQASQVVETPADPIPEPEGTPDTDSRRVSTRNQPRWDAMDEVVSRHEKEVAPETTAPVEAAVEAVPADPVTEATVAPVVAPEAPKTVKQTVDGVDHEVPLSEIEEAGGERAWRIDKASKNRLEESKATLAEAKRAQAAIAQWAQQNLPQRPAQPQVSNQEFVQTRVNMIRQGNDQEAAQAVQELLQGNRVDTSAIQNQVLIRVNRMAAVNKFREEFSDILANPLIYKLAATLENEQGANINPAFFNTPEASLFDWGPFYRNIGNQLRGVVGRPTQPAPVPQLTTGTPSQSSEGKEAKKASIVNLPTAAAPRAQPPAEEKPQTHAEILNEMRKGRGQLTG